MRRVTCLLTLLACLACSTADAQLVLKPGDPTKWVPAPLSAPKSVEVTGSRFFVVDATDGTKVLKLDVSGIATGTTRTFGVPNASGTLAIVSGDLGTPSAAVLTNATGLPLGTGVTGTLLAAQFPALTGDVTTTAGALATTIGASKVTNAMLAGSIAASKLVGTDIVTTGTITTGTWTGTIIDTARGGTGVNNSTGGTANQFWARPDGATGAATYRAMVAADVPTLNQNTTGYASALKSATTTVSVSAATAPTTGQVLTATSGTAATWQAPASGTAALVTVANEATDTTSFLLFSTAATGDLGPMSNANLAFNAATGQLTLGVDSLINGLTVGKGSGSIATNTVLGRSAGLNQAAGALRNVLIGDQVGKSISTGNNNTLVGYGVGEFGSQTNVGNTWIGSLAGNNAIASNSICIGAVLCEGNNTTVIGTNQVLFRAYGTPRFSDGADATKILNLNLSSIGTLATRTWTVPDVSDTFVGLTATQTMTNKTLTSPTLTTPDLGTPSAIVLTNASGTASININGTVGATTPAAGTFTALTGTSGSITGLTGLGIRSTGAAFDLTIASSEVLTAGRTLSLNVADAARSLSLTGNPTLSGITTTGTGTYASGTFTLTVGAASAINQNVSTTASPQFAGLGIGTAPIPEQLGRFIGTTTGGVAHAGLVFVVTGSSGATTSIDGISGQVASSAAAYTVVTARGVRVNNATLGAGSTIVNQIGVDVLDQTVASTLIAGFRSQVTSGLGKWGVLSSGTAANAFNGLTRFGGVTAPVATVDVTGSMAATTTILSSGATSGIGYATGAGGSIVQVTSRVTGVVLNKICGTIQTDTTALLAGTNATFTVTNSAVAIGDVVDVAIRSGATNVDTFVHVTATAAGSFNITVSNKNAAVSEVGAIILNFVVTKSVSS